MPIFDGEMVSSNGECKMGANKILENKSLGFGKLSGTNVKTFGKMLTSIWEEKFNDYGIQNCIKFGLFRIRNKKMEYYAQG